MTEEGRPTRWRWRAPCGDEIERAGDQLIITAALPIEGLETSRFRNPVVRIRNERFTLTTVEGSEQRPIYRFTLEVPNLYAPPGDLVLYDGERHIERAQERKRLALAWVLFLPLVPLAPFIGLLPEGVKVRLAALGFNPAGASRLSLFIEWGVLALAVVAYLVSGGFMVSRAGLLLGLLAMLLALDITYRVASDYEGRAPGMFGVVGALRTWLVDSWRALRSPRLPGSASHDDDERP